MTCIPIKNGIVCIGRFYQYGGFTFEWHSWLGPMRLRKKDLSVIDGEPPKRFYDKVEEWAALEPAEKERYRV